MTDTTTRPAVWPHLLWITAAAVVVDLGGLHRLHHSDSFIPVLSSLYRWTPYYWEQDRYGMLTALLAAPFSHPVTNLLVQNGITVWAGLACFPLAARYLFRDRSWRVVGPASAAAFLLLAPAGLQWQFLSTFNVFAVSLALGLAGLLAVAAGSPRWPVAVRWGVAVACVAVGAWVNSAVGVLLAQVVVLVAAARRATGESGAASDAANGVGLSAVAVVVGALLPRISSYRDTKFAVPPAGEWPGRLAEAVRLLWDQSDPTVWGVFGGVVAAVGAAGLLITRSAREARRGLVVWAAVAAAVLPYAAVMAVMFDGRYRYAIPGMVLVHVAAVGWAVRVVLPAATGRWSGAAAVAAVVAAVAAYGWPSPDRVRRDLRGQFGQGVDDLIAARCTHVAGNYWRVWPAVFVANWEYRDRGEDRPVWGLSFRSGPTDIRWGAVPRGEVRVGVFAGDPDGPGYASELLGGSFVLAERRGEVEVYVPE